MKYRGHAAFESFRRPEMYAAPGVESLLTFVEQNDLILKWLGNPDFLRIYSLDESQEHFFELLEELGEVHYEEEYTHPSGDWSGYRHVINGNTLVLIDDSASRSIYYIGPEIEVGS